jgi:hypothetical protein
MLNSSKLQMKRIFLLFLGCFVLLPLFAVDSGNEIAVKVVANKNNVLDVQENYQLFFDSPRHGFYRVIPTNSSNDYMVRVSDIRCSEKFSVDRQSGNVMVKVGDPDRLVSGVQHYTLSYSYDIGADQNDGYDLLYYNILGTGWQLPFDRLDFTIQTPFDLRNDRIVFSRGAYGSVGGNVNYTLSDDGKTISGTAYGFAPGEGLTVNVRLPDGSFVGARDPIGIARGFFVPYLALLVLLLGLVFALYLKYGKDEKLIDVETFDPPDDLSPMLLAHLLKGSANDSDAVAMLFYWADKGYISIQEEETGKGMFAKKSYTYTCLAAAPKFTSTAEEQLYHVFLGATPVVGMSHDPSQFGSSFVEGLRRAETECASYFEGEHSLKNKKSKRAKLLAILLGAVAFVVLSIALGKGIPAAAIAPSLLCFLLFLVLYVPTDRLINHSAGKKIFSKAGKIVGISLLFLIVCAADFLIIEFLLAFPTALSFRYALGTGIFSLLLSILTAAIEKRSPYAQQILQQALGFKSFIEYVELDKLKRLIDEQPMLYYHLLSYAIVLGLEKKWSKKFETFHLDNPVWYTGPGIFMYSGLYMGLSSSLQHTISETMRAQAAHSGGGIGGGGGGFSGGGFGGGGGGTW